MSYGIALLAALLYPLYSWYLHKKAMAMIDGSGVRVGERQFPEIYRCLTAFKQRLGMTKDVTVYIVEDNIANAFAVKYGKKNVILLTDDLIHGCLASSDPRALSFVIEHELAHIALNHNGLLRSWIARHMKKLSRMDEYTADAVGLALVEKREIAFGGILLLTVGYALLPFVSAEQIADQARAVAQNKYSKKAERLLTHPLALNRLHRILTARV